MTIHLKPLRRIGAGFLCLVASFAIAAEPARKTFNIPAGPAEKALRTFTEQSGLQVGFPTEVTNGVRTNEVKGELTALEAAARLLAGTNLKLVAGDKTGVYSVARVEAADPNAGRAAQPTPSDRPTQNQPGRASAADEGAVVLSPFEVSASLDRGYVAAQTLAGTRIASDIKNVAAQISVMTPEFLQDIAAVSLDEAQLYSLNVENHQEYSNGAVGDGTSGVENLTGAQRVRGLTNASNTRDFFGTFFALDTYNSERFTFNSGPNAILFGLGSPAGIIDQSLKRANFKNSYQFGFRFDSEGSHRFQFDLNRRIIPNVLAVRLNLLYDNEESWRKPSRDRQRRQYVTTTYKPFKATTVRFAFENVRREAAIPRNTLIKDFVTPYLTWRAARMQALGTSDPLDPRLYWAPASQLNAGESAFQVGRGTPFASDGIPTFLLNLVTGQFAPSTPAKSLLGRVDFVVSPTNPIGEVMRSRGPHEDVAAPDNFNYSLLDPSIFPYDINVGGLGSDNEQRGKIYNVFVEHQFSRNFVIEAAFQKQDYHQLFTDWLRGTDQILKIDVNRFLGGVADAAGRPVLNPNRGKYYIESWGRGSVRYGHTESARLTASYRLDFSEKPGWRRWLGTHNFAGLMDLNRSLDANQSHRELLYSDSPDVNVLNPADHSLRQVYHRVYLDAPGTPGISYFDVGSARRALNAEPYGPARAATVSLRPTNLDQGIWAAGNVKRTETVGRMLALQSLFLKERIVLTYGKRRDEFKSRTNNTPIIDPVSPASSRPWYWNNFADVERIEEPNLDGNLDIHETGSQETRGVVVTLLPFVSLHYNESSNRQAGSPGLNPNGGFHAPASGEGRDYGFSLRLLDRRVYLKANWYENDQTRSSSSEFGNLRFSFAAIETRLLALAEQNPQVGYKPSTTWDPVLNVTNSPVLSDLSAQGLELSITANPTQNWRVSVTAAKTETTEVNIAGEWIDYMATRTPEWSKFYAYARNDFENVAQGAQTVKEAIDNEISFLYLDRAKIVSGRPSEQVRRWRVNFVTSYDFTRGWIRNFGVGGAVRWRDRASIGLPLIKLPNGAIVQDIKNPWYDDGLIDIDGWLSYKMRLFDGKIRTRFQLNIRNVLDSDKLLPQRATTTGERRLFTVQAPRQFIFTATFDL